MTPEELSAKWWYRLFLVVLCFLAILIVFLGAIIAYETKPTLNAYSSTYQVHCTDSGSLLGEMGGNTLTSNYTDADSELGKQVLRLRCQYPTEKILPTVYMSLTKPCDLFETQERVTACVKHRTLYEIPNEKNYTIVMKNPVYNGSWGKAGMTAAIAALIALVLFFGSRSIFMFVATGRFR